MQRTYAPRSVVGKIAARTGRSKRDVRGYFLSATVLAIVVVAIFLLEK
ncbi:MAG: hypothetical protein JWM36_4200 [Hyphomicrobiales bacterium]|nr:hypothetical protein [Hyphomicrobiales bacterium]